MHPLFQSNSFLVYMKGCIAMSSLRYGKIEHREEWFAASPVFLSVLDCKEFCSVIESEGLYSNHSGNLEKAGICCSIKCNGISVC